MVRTIITPDHANIALDIPESYVGKKLEVLVYTVDEVQEKSEPKVETLTIPKKPSEFGKILSDEQVELFQEHIKQSREEWKNRF